MKHTTLGLLCMALLGMISCNAIKEIQLQAKTDTSIAATVSFPFTYTKKLIVVEAMINANQSANRFIFDTGAFQSKIEYNLAAKNKLSTVAKRSNSTAQGIKRQIEITSLDSVKFSHARFFNIAAGKLKYDAKSYSPCIAEDGIIGANLIKLAHWKIDYQKKEMAVSATPILSDHNPELIPIAFNTSFLSGIPTVDVEIDGQVIKNVIFDLGYNGGLVVPYRFADQFQSTSTQTIIDQSTAGIFGANRDTLVVKELAVKLGKFATKIPVEFSSLNKALMGNDFLEHFTIYLNYKENKITLKPISAVKIDQVKTFIPGVLSDSLWIVNRTNPQIPLEIGDTLKSINGYQPQDLYQSHCDYFLRIPELLNMTTLSIETIEGRQIKLNLNH